MNKLRHVDKLVYSIELKKYKFMIVWDIYEGSKYKFECDWNII
jgi:hypothetical protein